MNRVKWVLPTCMAILSFAVLSEPLSISAQPMISAAMPMAVQDPGASQTVSGTWNLETKDKDGKPALAGTLNIKQEGQVLSGEIVGPKRTFKIDGKISGDQISFTLKAPMGHHVDFTGTVKDGSMSGTNDRGGSWTATK